MPTLRRHQPSKFKLPRAWKFILALMILVALVVFKDLFFSLEKNEKQQTPEESGTVQKQGAVSDSAVSPSQNQNIQPAASASSSFQAPVIIRRSIGENGEED